jgi:hypothetical protein
MLYFWIQTLQPAEDIIQVSASQLAASRMLLEAMNEAYNAGDVEAARTIYHDVRQLLHIEGSADAASNPASIISDVPPPNGPPSSSSPPQETAAVNHPEDTQPPSSGWKPST